MDGFARRKEQSKEEIRKAAWELFSQFGVDKVSMTDIARKAGVSPATIYNNFDSKEALAREFVSGMVEELVSRRAGDRHSAGYVSGKDQCVLSVHLGNDGGWKVRIGRSGGLCKQP